MFSSLTCVKISYMNANTLVVGDTVTINAKGTISHGRTGTILHLWKNNEGWIAYLLVPSEESPFTGAYAPVLPARLLVKNGKQIVDTDIPDKPEQKSEVQQPERIADLDFFQIHDIVEFLFHNELTRGEVVEKLGSVMRVQQPGKGRAKRVDMSNAPRLISRP